MKKNNVFFGMIIVLAFVILIIGSILRVTTLIICGWLLFGTGLILTTLYNIKNKDSKGKKNKNNKNSKTQIFGLGKYEHPFVEEAATNKEIKQNRIVDNIENVDLDTEIYKNQNIDKRKNANIKIFSILSIGMFFCFIILAILFSLFFRSKISVIFLGCGMAQLFLIMIVTTIYNKIVGKNNTKNISQNKNYSSKFKEKEELFKQEVKVEQPEKNVLLKNESLIDEIVRDLEKRADIKEEVKHKKKHH